MKKVWVLEKFASAEEMAKHHEEHKAMVAMAKDAGKSAEEIASLEEFVADYEKVIRNNPDGRWYGFEGKVIYRQFCDCAKAAIRRNPDGEFRVVEAEIGDDAWSWLGYKNAKVNDGVLRYLMATK